MQTEIRPSYIVSSETGHVYVIEYRLKAAFNSTLFKAYLSVQVLTSAINTYERQFAIVATESEAKEWALGIVSSLIAAN